MSGIVYIPHRHEDELEEPSRANVGSIAWCGGCREYVECRPLMIGGVFYRYFWGALSKRQLRKARKAGHISELAAA